MKPETAAILTPTALYSLVAAGVSGAGLSGGAVLTTTLATIGLGMGMTTGLVFLGLTGVFAFETVKKIQSHRQSNRN